MKILIITVAGLSSRFSKSLGKECLKCLYPYSDMKKSLLYRMLDQSRQFDRYIIVGGYLYEELVQAVQQDFAEYADKITLVKNEKYAEYGSGYSLYKGVQAVIDTDFEEVVFAEGDLFVDRESFWRICDSGKDVVTANSEDILADRAVAFYFDTKNQIHYIYDTSHNELYIEEPFMGIFNSGQIWKFRQPQLMRKIYDRMPEKDWQGTNLVFIENYFREIPNGDFERIKFKRWINCNTVDDFNKI